MAPRFHALLLPYPAQGHINPMLHLASTLASRGCSVTFVTTKRSHSSVLLAAQRDTKTSADLIGKDISRKQTLAGADIRFFTISDGLPDSFKLDMSEDALFRLADGIQRQKGALEELIDGSRTGNNPISCIVADALFPWAQDLAESVGLPGVILSTTNACSLQIICLKFSGQLTREAVESNELADLQNVCISKHELLPFSDRPVDSGMGKLMKEFFDSIGKASQILVNSFRELESFSHLPKPIASKTRLVGPLLPAEHLVSKSGSDVRVGTSVSGEDLEYVRWLDMQGDCSVLFISFGSLAALPPAQIEEIATGIEESNLKFLWVARPDTEGKIGLPDGFSERTKDRGRTIPWAQQLEVLLHRATGGFFTHCGWNSTLESIFMGVPMLCLPAFAEQSINRDLIVKQWQVGLALQNSDGAFTREQVKRAAMELMDGNEGLKIRQRAKLLKIAATQAVSEGGSSNVALSEFIDFIAKVCKSEK